VVRLGIEQPLGATHRAHFELTLRAAKNVQTNLLLRPIIWDDMPPPTSTSSMSKESYLCF